MIQINHFLVTLVVILIGIIAALGYSLVMVSDLAPQLAQAQLKADSYKHALEEEERRTRFFLTTAKDAAIRLYHCENGSIMISQDNLQFLTTTLPELTRGYKQELSRISK